MKNLTSLFLFATVLAIFTSCEKLSIPEDPAYSYVMAVNAAASTSSGTVNVSVGNQSMPDIPFGGNSFYTQVAAADNPVIVEYAGNRDSSNISFEKGKAYSLFTVDDSTGLKPVLVEDYLPGNTVGIANIRFLQFSSDAPAMDIVIGGNIIFHDRNYNDQAADPSLAAFITIVPGTYDIEVRDPITSNLLYTFTGIVIGEGKTYNMIAKGSVNGVNDQGFGITLVANN